MSLRLSFGMRWVEIHLFSGLMLGSMLLLSVEYGNCSKINLVYARRDEDGRILFKWRKNKARWITWFWKKA